jgi:hypothetical protein
MTNEPTYRLKSHLTLEADPDSESGVLVDSHSASMMSCNGTGWLIVKGLTGTSSVQEIVDGITGSFDADVETVRRDTLDFLRHLSAAGFVDAA